MDSTMESITISVEQLHLCTFKTPTKSAVMSKQGDADLWLPTSPATEALQMRNGVKQQYIESLSIKEKKAYDIAFHHLGSSFTLEKSIGFLEWKKTLPI